MKYLPFLLLFFAAPALAEIVVCASTIADVSERDEEWLCTCSYDAKIPECASLPPFQDFERKKPASKAACVKTCQGAITLEL